MAQDVGPEFKLQYQKKKKPKLFDSFIITQLQTQTPYAVALKYFLSVFIPYTFLLFYLYIFFIFFLPFELFC
jgi:hypothetical protein